MSEKKRVRGRDLAKEALWRRRMSSQRDSGLSVRAFCQGEGLGEARFHWWRRELALRDLEVDSVGEREGDRRGQAPDGPVAAFVEVSCSEPARAVSSMASPVEVVLRGGRVLRVRADFSPETVSRLVALLEAESC